MITTQLPLLTEYPGDMPDKINMNAKEYAVAVFALFEWYTKVYLPEENTRRDVYDVIIAEMNTVYSAVKTQAVVGGYSQEAVDALLNDSGSPRYTYKEIASGEDSFLYIDRPDGAEYSSVSADETGAIRVILPQFMSNSMVMFDINIYDNSLNDKITFRIKGYIDSSLTWTRYSSMQIGGTTKYNVIFGATTTKNCIQIGEVDNTELDNIKVYVSDLAVGHENATYIQWATGWSMSRELSLPDEVIGTIAEWVWTSRNKLGNGTFYFSASFPTPIATDKTVLEFDVNNADSGLSISTSGEISVVHPGKYLAILDINLSSLVSGNSFNGAISKTNSEPYDPNRVLIPSTKTTASGNFGHISISRVIDTNPGDSIWATTYAYGNIATIDASTTLTITRIS